jgi:hypothetical protein
MEALTWYTPAYLFHVYAISPALTTTYHAPAPIILLNSNQLLSKRLYVEA